MIDSISTTTNDQRFRALSDQVSAAIQAAISAQSAGDLIGWNRHLARATEALDAKMNVWQDLRQSWAQH